MTRSQKELALAYVQGDKINRMAKVRIKQQYATMSARKAMGEVYRTRRHEQTIEN